MGMGLGLGLGLGARRRASGGAAPLVFPLDDVASPQAIYGSSQLLAGYSGPLLRLYRAADSAEVDIFPDSSGNASIDDISAFSSGGSVNVKVLYDQSGNAFNAVQSDPAYMGWVAPDFLLNGCPVISLKKGFFNLHASITLTRNNFSICGVFANHNSQVETSGMFAVGADATGINCFNQSLYFGSALGQNTAFAPQVAPRYFELSIDSTTRRLISGDDILLRTMATTASVHSGGFLGNLYPSNYQAAMSFVAFGFFAAAFTSGVRSLVESQFIQKFDCATSDECIIFNGDSITQTTTVEVIGQNYPYRTSQLLPSKPRMFNVAGGGQRISGDLGTNFDSQEGYIFDRYVTAEKYVFVFKGTNDLSLDARTSAQIYADIQSYCAKCWARGAKVIVSTITPTQGWSAGQQATRDELNSLIRSNWATFADALCDFASDSVLGPQAAASDASIFIDGLHLSRLGHSNLARVAIPVIASTFAA